MPPGLTQCQRVGRVPLEGDHDTAKIAGPARISESMVWEAGSRERGLESSFAEDGGLDRNSGR